jgi:hypothetical protein
MAFDVQAPELLEGTTTAAARWSKATGCDVRVETDGIPVRWATTEELTHVDDVTGDAGTTANGRHPSTS